VLCFSRRSLIKSSRHQRLNFPDPKTRRDIICHHPELREDDPGRPLKTKDKGDGAQPELIQHVDVESLFSLFVESFISSMRGGNTDIPIMLDFCLRFPSCINNVLKRVTGTRYRYFTNPVASYYLQPTLGDVDVNFCDLPKLPKPSSGCLTKKQWNELRQWTQQYGRSVRQWPTIFISLLESSLNSLTFQTVLKKVI